MEDDEKIYWFIANVLICLGITGSILALCLLNCNNIQEITEEKSNCYYRTSQFPFDEIV